MHKELKLSIRFIKGNYIERTQDYREALNGKFFPLLRDMGSKPNLFNVS